MGWMLYGKRAAAGELLGSGNLGLNAKMLNVVICPMPYWWDTTRETSNVTWMRYPLSVAR
jgi:hypothetical protein